MKKPVNPFKAEKKERSLNAIANQAWRLMSEYVRRSEADSNGNCTCVSCGRFGAWTEFDAGHFVHAGRGGKHNPVSYDARNVHAQCRHCNRQIGAKYRHPGTVGIKYAGFMVGKYGPEIIDQLEAIKKQPWFRHAELEAQIEILKRKLSVLDRAKKWQKEVA